MTLEIQGNLHGHAALATNELWHSGHEFSLGITGKEHGAGVSTAAKTIAEFLQFRYAYAGGIFRRTARRFITDPSLNDEQAMKKLIELTENDPRQDTKLDMAIVLRAFEGSVVFEGKAAVTLAKAELLPKRDGTVSTVKIHAPIYTVLLTCDPSVSARRGLFRDWCKKNGVDPSSLTPVQKEEIMSDFSATDIDGKRKVLLSRMEKNRVRWDGLYNLTEVEAGKGAFGLVIDTTSMRPEDVQRKILFYLLQSRAITKESGLIYARVQDRLGMNA